MADLVAGEDQQRAAIVSRFFHFVGDLTAGIDSSPRLDAQWVRADGQLGTANGTDVALGSDGQVYVRGRTATAAASAPATGTTAATGLVLTPGLLLLGLAAFLLLRR